MTEELRRRTRFTNLPGGGQFDTAADEFIGTVDSMTEEYVEQFDRDRFKITTVDNEILRHHGPVNPASITLEFMVGGQGSKFSVFANSLVKVIPELADVDPEKEDQWSYVIGQRLHFNRVEVPLRQRNKETNQWHDVATPCWQVIAAVQATPKPTVSSSPEAVALALLDGKTEDEWVGEAVRDPIVKKDINLVRKIIEKQFVAEALAAGKIKAVPGDKPNTTKFLVLVTAGTA